MLWVRCHYFTELLKLVLSKPIMLEIHLEQVLCGQFEDGSIPLSQARGLAYGYYTNSAKSILLDKPDKLQEAHEQFEETGVEIRITGVRYLGAAIGSPSFKYEYITEKVQTWVAEIKSLSAIAKTQPQAAYAVLVHAMKHKWAFMSRTMQESPGLFTELGQAIYNFLIPAMTDRPPVSREERQILSLPYHDGGLGLINPTQPHHYYQDSAHLIRPLEDNIVAQVDSLRAATAMLAVRKRQTQLATRARERTATIEIRESADKPMKVLLEMASEKGASSWLTCRPLRRHGFTLHKTAFRDGLCLRYGWTPEQLPSLGVFGRTFSVDYALTCTTGGHTVMRHNEFRDQFASYLRKEAHDVVVEPPLQPLAGERFPILSTSTEEFARLDFAASGVWGGRFKRSFMDIRVFNPHAPSNAKISVPSMYKRHEAEKRRRYDA